MVETATKRVRSALSPVSDDFDDDVLTEEDKRNIAEAYEDFAWWEFSVFKDWELVPPTQEEKERTIKLFKNQRTVNLPKFCSI